MASEPQVNAGDQERWVKGSRFRDLITGLLVALAVMLALDFLVLGWPAALDNFVSGNSRASEIPVLLTALIPFFTAIVTVDLSPRRVGTSETGLAIGVTGKYVESLLQFPWEALSQQSRSVYVPLFGRRFMIRFAAPNLYGRTRFLLTRAQAELVAAHPKGAGLRSSLDG